MNATSLPESCKRPRITAADEHVVSPGGTVTTAMALAATPASRLDNLCPTVSPACRRNPAAIFDATPPLPTAPLPSARWACPLSPTLVPPRIASWPEAAPARAALRTTEANLAEGIREAQAYAQQAHAHITEFRQSQQDLVEQLDVAKSEAAHWRAAAVAHQSARDALADQLAVSRVQLSQYEVSLQAQCRKSAELESLVAASCDRADTAARLLQTLKEQCPNIYEKLTSGTLPVTSERDTGSPTVNVSSRGAVGQRAPRDTL